MATLQFSEGSDNRPAIRHRSKQLINNIIDGTAKERPRALYAEIPRLSDSYEGGYRPITYRALANAINGVAWFLKENLGKREVNHTLAYFGPNDIGYVVMVLGAVKAGHRLLLVSPRNTVSDHIALFQATNCHILLTSSTPHSAIAVEISKAHLIQVIDSPGLNQLLSTSYLHYPFPKSFTEARKEVLVIVHTSGTTAVPKPIVYSHDFAASYVQWCQLEPPPGFESQVSLCQSNRVFMTLPFFHAGNLTGTVFQAIANQSTIVTRLAGAMPSAQLIVDGLKYAKADALILAPPFLEQIAVNEENLSFIGHTVDTVIYGGGGISQKSGDALASRVKLLNFHAATEMGSYPLLRPAGKFPYEDWKFIFPHPAAGLVFRPSIHGLFESVVIRHSEPEDEQPVFKVFPHLAEYPTKDLWEPHPTKPDLWTHKGRVDDTIVFKPGYMCDPTIMEQQVLQHPEVKAVLMAGTGRSQPALLIEGGSQKRLSRAEEQELLEQLWPIIEEANKAYKLGARVSRSHIVFTRLQQPIRRTGKGTVQRASTLEMYKDTLDELYAREGDAMPENQLVLPGFDTKSQ